MYDAVVWSLALSVSAIAAYTDARTKKIPNWLTAAALGVIVPIQLLNGWSNLAGATAGLAISALVPLCMYFASQGKALGGGDVKLFAVLGAALGAFQGLELQLLSYVVLLSFALCQLSYRGKLFRTLIGSVKLLLRPLRRGEKQPVEPELLTSMPLGPAILIACLLLAAYRHFPWVQALI
ncbi:MAG TPA: prepilin peptidase [Polyangiaceae bacterium]|jgi:prepilin peptidase CpaA|nr:prepilin peptidase [Polyangiaceae bacterium]